MDNQCSTGTREVHQCKTCPWKVGSNPEEEIPGYDRKLHIGLKNTIAGGDSSFVDALRGRTQIMACHYSKDGNEIPCAGWLENQLGAGNNIAVRMRVGAGSLPVPVTSGKQHETFEATLRDAPTRKIGKRRFR